MNRNEELKKSDGTELSASEKDNIKKLSDDLYSPTTIDKFSGKKTNEILDVLKVESPAMKGSVLISSNPYTLVKPLGEDARSIGLELEGDEKYAGFKKAWIKRMKRKFKLK